MKNRLILTCLAATVALIGCQKKKEEPKPKPTMATNLSLKPVIKVDFLYDRSETLSRERVYEGDTIKLRLSIQKYAFSTILTKLKIVFTDTNGVEQTVSVQDIPNQSSDQMIVFPVSQPASAKARSLTAVVTDNEGSEKKISYSFTVRRVPWFKELELNKNDPNSTYFATNIYLDTVMYSTGGFMFGHSNFFVGFMNVDGLYLHETPAMSFESLQAKDIYQWHAQKVGKAISLSQSTLSIQNQASGSILIGRAEAYTVSEQFYVYFALQITHKQAFKNRFQIKVISPRRF